MVRYRTYNSHASCARMNEAQSRLALPLSLTACMTYLAAGSLVSCCTFRQGKGSQNAKADVWGDLMTVREA